MNKPAFAVKDNDFDIKRICLDILRDLYSASRKLMMYPADHPIANETLKKPLERLNDIYAFKRSFNIRIYNNRLVAEGLLMEDNVFVNGLLIDLARHNLDSVTFNSEMGVGDLFQFLSKLIEDKSPVEDYFKKSLSNSNVSTVVVNNPESATLYNFEDIVIGDRSPKFMLNQRIKNILQSNPEILMAYYLGKIKTDDNVASVTGIDLRCHFLTNHFAAIIGNLSEDMALEVFKKVIYSANWLDETINQEVLQGLHQLWEDYSGQNEDFTILLPVYDLFRSVGATDDVLEIVFNKGTLIKLRGVIDAEEFIRHLKNSQAREIDFLLLRKTVFKLASNSYGKPLEDLLDQLAISLLAKDLDTRQRSLRLTIEALQTLTDGSFWEIYNSFIKKILQIAHTKDPGPEVIELIGWTIENSAQNNHWEELKICVQVLKSLAEHSTDDYKKKLAEDRLEELAVSSIMNDILVDAVLTGKGDVDLYRAISALASPKVASVLIDRIDMGDKSERARIIKALVHMGEGIGSELTKSIATIVKEGEGEKEKNWYRLRNLLRVVGRIKYVETIPYLKIMSSWESTRLKREIISACEAMASSATGSLLSKLALDDDSDIRKTAVIAMGMSGHSDMINFLRNIFDDPRSDRILVIAALGRIGGPHARDIIIDLYEDEDAYSKLNIGKKEEQGIKLAILKSLSKIDDDISRSKMQLYSSKRKKSLFKKDVLSRTATILLGDHKK
ncbi:MAG: HEAT repeat domain-containing protein [candidate division Zixibacteria bacterium]|nr:HEAT repeat domain-containing protein [candidate division Zixibacteria bacterium]